MTFVLPGPRGAALRSDGRSGGSGAAACCGPQRPGFRVDHDQSHSADMAASITWGVLFVGVLKMEPGSPRASESPQFRTGELVSSYLLGAKFP